MGYTVFLLPCCKAKILCICPYFFHYSKDFCPVSSDTVHTEAAVSEIRCRRCFFILF